MEVGPVRGRRQALLTAFAVPMILTLFFLATSCGTKD